MHGRFKTTVSVVFFKKALIYLGHTTWRVGSWFPDQGLNPCPLPWRHGVPTTGPPGKALSLVFLFIFFFNLELTNKSRSLFPPFLLPPP